MGKSDEDEADMIMNLTKIGPTKKLTAANITNAFEPG